MDNSKDTFAILSVVFGALGIFIFTIVFGPLAIIFGVLGLKGSKRTMAIVGIILGIIDIVLIFLVIGVLLWQMGVFSPGSGSSSFTSDYGSPATITTFTGFGSLKPIEWAVIPARVMSWSP